MLTLLAIGFLAWLVFGYFAYGCWIAKQFWLDDSRTTPANEVNDGEDFVPTQPFYLFGQHFSAIADAVRAGDNAVGIGNAGLCQFAGFVGGRRKAGERFGVACTRSAGDLPCGNGFDKTAQCKKRYVCRGEKFLVSVGIWFYKLPLASASGVKWWEQRL